MNSWRERTTDFGVFVSCESQVYPKMKPGYVRVTKSIQSPCGATVDVGHKANTTPHGDHITS